jgi:hypothetical protein
MICSILGSGSRRIKYVENDYSSIGCNIPYTNASRSVIFDEQIIDIISKPEYKLVVHNRVFVYLKRNRPDLLSQVECVFDHDTNKGLRLSSGHYAALYMIQIGYTKLDLYGMDSFFKSDNWANSYTDQFVSKPTGIPVDIVGAHWKREWEMMIKRYPKVNFNFI